MTDFYCYQCGAFKDISVKRPRKGKRSVCALCFERAAKIAAKSDATRHKRRAYLISRNAFDINKFLNKEKN